MTPAAHNLGGDTREKLLELAERCEAATGPDRELDADIWIALNIPTERVGRIDKDAARGVVGWHPLDGPYKSAIEVPRFTASLDAAMTISPVTRQVDVLLDAISACRSDEDGWLRDLPRFVCAAALRARNEQVTI